MLLHTLSQTRPELLQHAAQTKMNVLGGMNPMQQGFMAAGDIKDAVEKLDAQHKASLAESGESATVESTK